MSVNFIQYFDILAVRIVTQTCKDNIKSNPYWSHLLRKQFWTVLAVNKHVLGGWCQQNRSVYEIIFSQNEHLNELLSPVDRVPQPVFNISWATFFWATLSVLVTHCLEIGNVYVSLELELAECWGDQAKFVCDCLAQLHRCGPRCLVDS